MDGWLSQLGAGRDALKRMHRPAPMSFRVGSVY
jgi:hypothetical protein